MLDTCMCYLILRKRLRPTCTAIPIMISTDTSSSTKANHRESQWFVERSQEAAATGAGPVLFILQSKGVDRLIQTHRRRKMRWRQVMTDMEEQNQTQGEDFQLSSELGQRITDAILEKQRASASSEQMQVQVSNIDSFRRHFNQLKAQHSAPALPISNRQQRASNQTQPSPELFHNTLHSQRLLKEYFQSYFSAIFSKMQQTTALKLQAISSRLQTIQAHLNQQRKPTLLSALQRPEKPPSRYQRKGTYIKNREKLDYIDKIQRGKTSIQQVALALNINQKIVRSWLTSKQAFREKEQRKQRDRDEMML